MIYDVIIIWAWAAWLFCSINLPKNLSKLILEKNDKPWIKVLLSGWERANVSNVDIEPQRDYFWQNKKALISIFKRFSNWDTISFFAENWIKIIEEDRWRLILESWDSKQLLSLLLEKSKENNTSLLLKSEVSRIQQNNLGVFEVKLLDWRLYKAKNVIVSAWWKSFSQVWTTWDWYNFANDFWIKVINPHRWLCWLVSRKDLSSISWVSTNLKVILRDKTDIKKVIYEEFWPLLFTHFWISWPVIFNVSVAIWEYLNKNLVENEEQKIKEDLFLELYFDLENTPKRIKSFFELEKNLENEAILIELQGYRSWKEAKVSWGWVSIDELDNFMQSKKQKGLFFIWEVVDITWKTWWFNLQWAWSSAFVCSQFFLKL